MTERGVITVLTLWLRSGTEAVLARMAQKRQDCCDHCWVGEEQASGGSSSHSKAGKQEVVTLTRSVHPSKPRPGTRSPPVHDQSAPHPNSQSLARQREEWRLNITLSPMEK